jgi:hypothetical protein
MLLDYAFLCAVVLKNYNAPPCIYTNYFRVLANDRK